MAGFKKAVRKASKFKGSIQGASGAGKTYTALNIMSALVALTDPGKRIAHIDTEKAAGLYGPQFDFDTDDDFGEGTKVSYHYKVLIDKMEAARKAGYGGVIIDSATHFWKEAGGFTRMIDAICERQKARGGKPDSFAAWKEIDPLYRELMNYIRQYPAHVILCIRCKQGYEDTVDSNGKKKKIKVGMEPEFREGFEYEMDAQFAIDHDHLMLPLKHRLGDVLDGKAFRNPGADVAGIIAEWLAGSTVTTEESKPQPQAEARRVADELHELIKGTTDIDKLREDVKVAIKTAYDNKEIAGEEYNALSAAWMERGKALKSASEAA